MKGSLGFAWLWFYNFFSCMIWAVVLYDAVTALLTGARPSSAFAQVSSFLYFIQTLAILEVIHSIIGLVKSPFFTTFVQVLSRLQVIWLFLLHFKAPQRSYSFYLLVIPWAMSEVPRYAFYLFHLVSEVPYSLFWLRYSLFLVLYPAGICGEIFTIANCLPKLKLMGVGYWYLTVCLILLYIPGGPFMYFHMLQQRKKQFKARKEGGQPPPPSKGVDFPFNEKLKQRSTTIVNQGAFAASIENVDKKAFDAVMKEKNWRFGYAKHVLRNVEICCRSNESCLRVAKEGLNFLWKNFEFSLPSGQSVSFADAMNAPPGKYEFQQEVLYTYIVKGTRTRDPKFEYYVPYQKFGDSSVVNIKGKELLAQLDKWTAAGTIDPEARDGIAAMVHHPEFHSTALSSKAFVLLGAGSAMGPLRVLLELGATIVAVDIDREPVWRRLITMARDSPGTMILPVKKPPEQLKSDDELFRNAGSDLLCHTPQIRDWIVEQQPGQQLVLGGYAYLDAAMFVRLSMAMDGIIEGVLAKRKDAAVAFLCSPTDVFVTSDEAYEARKAAARNAPLWQKLVRLLLPKRMLAPNAIPPALSEDGKAKYPLNDGLSIAQGPNYALAKRIQHWRCMLAREAGHIVSTNIAPSTATLSVVHNPQFAAAYIGMEFFAPMEIFYQDLSNSVMTALLLNDLNDQKSFANPKVSLGNQIRLFAAPAFHGGIWRMAFKINSIGEVSGLIGYCKIYASYLYLIVGVFATFAAFIYSNGAPHNWM